MRRTYKRLIQWSIVLACVVYLSFFFTSNWPDLRKTLELTRVFNPLVLGIILSMQCIYYALNAYSLRIVVHKYSKKKIPYTAWFKIFMLGRFLNKLAAQTGNIYRSTKLKKDFDISYTEYVTIFISFFWFDIVFNFIVALVIFSLFGSHGNANDIRIVYLLVSLVLCAVAAPLIANAILKRITFKSRWPLWAHTKLSEVFGYAVENLRDYPFMAKLLSMNILVFLHNGLLYYICFFSMGVSVSPAEIAVFYALSKIGTYINITPGNLGVQELYSGFISEFLGIGMGQGVIISVIVRSIGFVNQIVLGILFGGLELLRFRKKADSDITFPS